MQVYNQKVSKNLIGESFEELLIHRQIESRRTRSGSRTIMSSAIGSSHDLRARRRQGIDSTPIDVGEATLSNGNSFNSIGTGNYCFWGLLSPKQTSWTRKNPRRRFHSCPLRKGEGHCSFFKWVDPVMTDRAKEMIMELRDRLGDKTIEEKFEDGEEVMPEALSSATIELNTVKEKVGQLKRSLKTEKRKTLMLTCSLVTSWMAFIIVCTIVVLIEWSRGGGYIGDRVRQLY